MNVPHIRPPSIYASRNEGSVVFAFRDAEPPLVWRYDLSRDPCFTMITRVNEAGWEVGFVQPSGNFSRIATFPERELADAALYKIARMVGTPIIHWGRLIALAMILAFSGIVVVSGFSTHLAGSKLAPILSSLVGSSVPGMQGLGTAEAASGFPALPGQVWGGFPAHSDMSSVAANSSGAAPMPQQYEIKAGNPMFAPEESVSQKEGIPMDADAVLKPPETAY
ncbi:MAG: hypothetical protein ABTQ34_00915 [Bdellovibrionales bacterium]